MVMEEWLIFVVLMEVLLLLKLLDMEKILILYIIR